MTRRCRASKPVGISRGVSGPYLFPLARILSTGGEGFRSVEFRSAGSRACWGEEARLGMAGMGTSKRSDAGEPTCP